MARIRSVHPGLFTDEVFMAASAFARILLIGLWTEADDQGVFEWKPLTLKARLLPVDAVDVVDLLSELEGADVVCRFEQGGKAYGAIRNFRKFQRPQKPTAQHPLPDNIAIYVHLSTTPTVAVEEPPDRPPINPPQMEDEGGGEGVSSLRSEGDAPSEAVGLWNATASRAKLSQVGKLTPARRTAIKARLKADGLEGWQDILRRIEASEFLCGVNDRGWRVDFDFASSERGYTRIREGKYDRARQANDPVEGVLVKRSDARWPQLVARYEQETGHSLKFADKWPFPELWLREATAAPDDFRKTA